MMRAVLFAAALFALAPLGASAQEAVQTRPLQLTTTMLSGTITVGGTFQSALAANANRHGCMLQNTSTHTMYVYLGATASATLANSFQLAAQATFNCTAGGIAVTDNIAITASTTADTWVLGWQ